MKTLHLKFFYIQKTVLKISLLKSNSGEVVVKGFAGGSMVKNLPANAGDAGDRVLIPGLGRSPGEGNGKPLQDSCLGNPTDRGAWRATVLGSWRVRHNWADGKKERTKGRRLGGRQQVSGRCLTVLSPGFHPCHIQMKPLFLFWFPTECLEPMWHSGRIYVWAGRLKCVWS